MYRAAEMPSLDCSPVPDLSLINTRHYSSMAIQYSRGCPFNCEFCDIIEIYGRKPRTKSVAQVIAELEQLHRHKWKGSVFLVDDNFIGNKKNVKQLLPAMAEWNDRHRRPFSFFTEASVNLADDPELLGMMKAAGFIRVFLGIETPVEASLREAHKLQNTHRSLLDSVRCIQQHGIEVMAGFIVGFDSDPDDVFDRQVEFIQESAIPIAMVGLLQALPGTQLYRRLGHEGRLGQRRKWQQHRMQSEFHSGNVCATLAGRVSVDIEAHLRPGRLLRTSPAVSGSLPPHKSHAPVALRLPRVVPFRPKAGCAWRRTCKLLEVSHRCRHTVPPCLRRCSDLGHYGLPLLLRDRESVPD